MKHRNLSRSCCCISHEFHKSASKTLDRIAVIHASPRRRTELAPKFGESAAHHPPTYEGDVCFTFSEVLAAVDSLSRRLRCILDGGADPYLLRPPSSGHFSIEQSMGTPRIVGIYMVPSVEYIISVLSVMRCGEAFMPLDPSWPKARLLSVISSSNASLIIGCSTISGNHTHQIDKSHWLVGSAGCPVLIISIKNNLKEHFASPDLLWPCVNKPSSFGDNRSRPFSYLMYTSGSSGKPKGVCGTEQGLLNRFLWMQDLYPLCGVEILLFKTSISFIDHLQEILGALLTSCTLIIPPFTELKENIFSISAYLQDYCINRLVAVPSLMRTLLPNLQSSCIMMIQSSLKLLVLSGEILHVPLWRSLTKLLPNTEILNLYGSTEVSGDCTYYDCKRLSSVLEFEELSTVPVGIPIPNCKVVLVGENTPNHGEIYVSGLCVAMGYFNYDILPLNAVKLLPGSSFCCSVDEKESVHCFKTGDFAKKLPGGDLVFLGRNDRTVKVNGQRIALEEIENTIREHEDVVDAAVIFNTTQGEVAHLEAYIVTKQGHHVGYSRSSFRGWMVDKLPLPMIPSCFFFIESIPMSSAGKVDYALLASSRCSRSDVCSVIEEVPDCNLLQAIKKVFCDALVVETVGDSDDFFAMGGDSISAAQASHKLGINMRLLYTFPSPLKLVMALREQGLRNGDLKLSVHNGVDMEVSEGSLTISNASKVSDVKTSKPRGRSSRKLIESVAEDHPSKVARMNFDPDTDRVTPENSYHWDSISKHTPCAFSRCNKVMFGDTYDKKLFQVTWSHGTLRDKQASIKKLWNVHMESCVDASPLIVVRESDIYVYLGSHSHKFLCMKASSGVVQWEVKLEGRVECSAAILGDFSEVVVGCYKGNIYFLNSLNGSIDWTFRTGGEVKSQPVVDKHRHLIWCGSYDHNLYALDYRSYCCAYKLHCGGSIYGSPAINEVTWLMRGFM